MNCPVDGTTLLVTDRSGVEIDYCPQCRGVWLDRGELDKIIDRSSGYRAPDYPEDAHRRSRHDRVGKRRREGFLGDLFDF